MNVGAFSSTHVYNYVLVRVLETKGTISLNEAAAPSISFPISNKRFY